MPNSRTPNRERHSKNQNPHKNPRQPPKTPCISLHLHPWHRRIYKPESNHIFQPINHQQTLRRHGKIAIHHIRHADIRDRRQADADEAEPDVYYGPVQVLLAPKADHEEAGCDDQGWGQ